MTMTTLTADPISHQHPPHQTILDTTSFNPKESTDTKSNVCGIANKCFTSTTSLRTISTSTFQATAANAVVNLPADDDDRNINETDSFDYPTFLQEWDAFCTEFAQSTTYTLVHSSAAQLMPSLIDDDDDDDQPMNECDNDQPPTKRFSESHRQL